MSTAHKTEEEKQEYFDTPEELDEKVTKLAQWVKESRHFVAFTGAGISTSAGVADFRSGINTVLKTGPGAWEKAATGVHRQGKVSVPMNKALPTPTHMALCALESTGLLKFLISQNVDGLHRRSGFPIDKMAELHGNTNLEICKTCKKQYMRDFRVRNNPKVHEHATDRKCESCGEMLYDTIVNFGEGLPKKAITDGFEQSAESDLCLVLGSSLRVTPAANMPVETVKNKGKLVIVNLQATPLDKFALNIHAMIDGVMILLMEKLKVEIPPFKLNRYLSIRQVPDTKKTEKEVLMIRGVDANGDPYYLFPQLDALFESTKETFTLKKEPFYISPEKAKITEGKLQLKLYFQGYYREPTLDTVINLADVSSTKDTVLKMVYDPVNSGKWEETKLIK